ncbi:MAG: glycosyltransferase [Anaerolineae bacterium]|nr:glycosyltransferase [Candidatus Roseilinea sp.]MDW8451126.1 glycosyltransferase [Anaerolineae bacterium]
MRRIRILQIIAGLDIGRTFGGAERIGIELACHLDYSEFEPTVCSFWQMGSRAESRWAQLLDEHRVPMFYATHRDEQRDSADYFKGVRRIIRWCAQNKVDIIHAHHEGGALAGGIAKLRGGASAVVRTAHTPLELEWGRGWKGFALRASFSHLVFPLLLDAELAVSREYCAKLQRRIVARLAGKRPRLVYSAIPRNSAPTSPDSVRIARRPPVIGSIGRLTHQKGHRYLIDAMPQVLAVEPEAQLWLIGEGELRAALQQQARARGVESQVCFLGLRDDIPDLLNRMNVFVLPSVWEGIPVVLLESIAAGVPVIASDLPGNRELIEHCRSGWLTPPGDTASLSASIIEALQNPQRAAAYAREAQKILPQFSIAAMVERHQTLYRSLIQV